MRLFTLLAHAIGIAGCATLLSPREATLSFDQTLPHVFDSPNQLTVFSLAKMLRAAFVQDKEDGACIDVSLVTVADTIHIVPTVLSEESTKERRRDGLVWRSGCSPSGRSARVHTHPRGNGSFSEKDKRKAAEFGYAVDIILYQLVESTTFSPESLKMRWATFDGREGIMTLPVTHIPFYNPNREEAH